MEDKEVISYLYIAFITIYNVIIIILLSLSGWQTEDSTVASILMIVRCALDILYYLYLIKYVNTKILNCLYWFQVVNIIIIISFTFVSLIRINDLEGIIKSAFTMYWVKAILIFFSICILIKNDKYDRIGDVDYGPVFED